MLFSWEFMFHTNQICILSGIFDRLSPQNLVKELLDLWTDSSPDFPEETEGFCVPFNMIKRSVLMKYVRQFESLDA